MRTTSAMLVVWAIAAQAAPRGLSTVAPTNPDYCSDGIFCNGAERYINGSCVRGPPPCDDGVACTQDLCSETQGGMCTYVPDSTCDECRPNGDPSDDDDGGNCTPIDCETVQCGDNGCGDSCGDCETGLSCDSSGVCAVSDALGTCPNPIPLTFQLGTQTVNGDTTTGVNTYAPKCNSITRAPEQFYGLVIPQSAGLVGYELRVGGGMDDFDTVIQILNGTCESMNVLQCSDDATPPGNYGSRVFGLLSPGAYLIQVDGYDIRQFGPFTMTVKLVANCVPVCDGAYCGSDGCGGSCGTCADDGECTALGRCLPANCQPDCTGKACGSDGCGGTCGSCNATANELCIYDDGVCQFFPPCDHISPTCTGGCGATEYCGTDCQCHAHDNMAPDLLIHRDLLMTDQQIETVLVTSTSCTLFEQCVGGSGQRKLFRFSVGIINQGKAPLAPPDPKENPDIFTYSPCHEHYHMRGLSLFELISPVDNTTVLTGMKLGYCMEDTERHLASPIFGCSNVYDCGHQGIQPGWMDVYGLSLDCQWLDITDIPAGDYLLRVSVNQERVFNEVNYDNNEVVVPVTIPGNPQSGGGDDAATGASLASTAALALLTLAGALAA